MKKKITKSEMGKKSRAAGARFEKRVREFLEKKDWIIDKWTNNVSKPFEQDIGEWVRELEPVKPKFIFDAKLKRRVMVGNSGGFPDFIIFRPTKNSPHAGVEAKMTGKLDKKEKEKCRWLLEKNIFSEIKIAYKGEKRGEILFKTFKVEDKKRK